MIPGDLLSAFPHRQFHTLPRLLDSWAALPNSYPNALLAMQGGNLYHLYDGLWYDPAERRTHDLPCERRTRYRLSQPDTVKTNIRRTTVLMYNYKGVSLPYIFYRPKDDHIKRWCDKFHRSNLHYHQYVNVFRSPSQLNLFK